MPRWRKSVRTIDGKQICELERGIFEPCHVQAWVTILCQTPTIETPRIFRGKTKSWPTGAPSGADRRGQDAKRRVDQSRHYKDSWRSINSACEKKWKMGSQSQKKMGEGERTWSSFGCRLVRQAGKPSFNRCWADSRDHGTAAMSTTCATHCVLQGFGRLPGEGVGRTVTFFNNMAGV